MGRTISTKSIQREPWELDRMTRFLVATKKYFEEKYEKLVWEMFLQHNAKLCWYRDPIDHINYFKPPHWLWVACADICKCVKYFLQPVVCCNNAEFKPQPVMFLHQLHLQFILIYCMWCKFKQQQTSALTLYLKTLQWDKCNFISSRAWLKGRCGFIFAL